MNREDTIQAGMQAGINEEALELAIAEARNDYEYRRNEDEMDALRATPPVCGKPGHGFKAWKRKYVALREESEEIYQNHPCHAIHDYVSANTMTFYPSDLRNGRCDEIRRRTQVARAEHLECAREFVAENYSIEDDDNGS